MSWILNTLAVCIEFVGNCYKLFFIMCFKMCSMFFSNKRKTHADCARTNLGDCVTTSDKCIGTSEFQYSCMLAHRNSKGENEFMCVEPKKKFGDIINDSLSISKTKDREYIYKKNIHDLDPQEWEYLYSEMTKNRKVNP